MSWEILLKISSSCMMILGAVAPFFFIKTTASFLFLIENVKSSVVMAVGTGVGTGMLIAMTGLVLLYGFKRVWKEK